MPAPNVPPAEMRVPEPRPRVETEPADRRERQRADRPRADRVTLSREARAAFERRVADTALERERPDRVAEDRPVGETSEPVESRRERVDASRFGPRAAGTSGAADGRLRRRGRIIDVRV